jgi:hypothetical protein
LAPNRYELTFAGQRLSSRATVEGYPLYRAAVLAREHRSPGFMLLHLPGQGGSADNPVHADMPLGLKYAHWQPHWSYLPRGGNWQPWQPEWGVPFWAETVSPENVAGYEAHAIVEFSNEVHRTAFATADVIADLATIAHAVEHNEGLHRGSDSQ